MKKLKRRSIRLSHWDYSNAGWHFVTKNNKVELSEYGNIVEKFWISLIKRYEDISLDEYVIMPNHFHGILAINNYVGAIHELPVRSEKKIHRKMLLPKIIGFFKMNSAKEINSSRHTQGRPFWHRNYYEHIIRNEKDLQRICEYIIENPYKWKADKYYPDKFDK